MKSKSPDRPPAAAIRCAIYTRKSTEEGLDQDFNSLDAQREAAEAYIASQKSEGWLALPERYDDGGFTGGNMDRPALRRLLADIESGKVDAVVTYKVDRLSRSLLDFSRIIEVLDRKQVSFVSVTQQFNTATSMGRLVLNVLLSFAQFEREIIAERTRDKMSAARRKGKWIGGNPVLGYNIDSKGRRLVVNDAEAEQVREIFGTYLRTHSLLDTVREIDRRGWTTKRRVSSTGRIVGGRRFDKTSLHALLRSRVFVGEIEYKDEVFAGEHPAVVDRAVWNETQEVLSRNGRGMPSEARARPEMILRGLLVCGACGTAMSTHFTVASSNRRYRYYVCTTANKRGWDACPTKSLPAEEIERFVVDQIREIGRDPEVRRRVIARVTEVAKGRRDELEREQADLVRQVRGLAADIRRVVGRPAAKRGGESDVAARLAELQAQVGRAEARLVEIRREVETVDQEKFGEADLAETLERFEPAWDAMAARERARVLQLLVERVTWNPERQAIGLVFRPNGIRALANGGGDGDDGTAGAERKDQKDREVA